MEILDPDECNWIEASLQGDVEEAARIQGLTSREARIDLKEWEYQASAEDLLPFIPTKVAHSPGFERLAAIMDIEPDPEPESKTLIENRVYWTRVLNALDEESS